MPRSGFTAAQRAYLDELLEQKLCLFRDELRHEIREDAEQTLKDVLLEGTRLMMLRDLSYDTPTPPRS